MPRVKIAVLRTDISWGERHSSLNSPIGLAIARVFPGVRRHIVIDQASIGGHTVKLPPKVKAFIRKWNQSGAQSNEFTPFAFVVNCPEKLADKAKKQRKSAKKK